MLKRFYFGLLISYLFSAFCAKAQVSVISNHTPLLFEKTYLHTDRDVYAPGDTLWFKAYLVNGQDDKPASSSGNLYVELIRADSAKIVLREIIRMENGLGHGDMTLADSLPAGHFTLRAYTNWMRNFGDNFVFEKDITLLDVAAVPVTKVPANDKRSTPALITKNKTASPPVRATNTLPIVRFFPEGGSFVSGISSFVGVKAEDGYGNGIPANGAVIAASGDTVAHFTCDSLGIGMFALLPIAGQSYRALAYLGSRHDVFQLPAALSKGLALQVKQSDTVIHAIVHAAGAGADSTLLMTVKHSGKTMLSQRFSLKNGQLAFKIGTEALPEGISAITIYNSENTPECERLVYIHHPKNEQTNRIVITTDKKSYQPKEKVSIIIQAQPNSNLSMAVVDAGTVPVQQENIISYLNLQSEIRGHIESPGRYFDTTNVNRFKQLDLLLLTQGWRNFVWKRMADTSIRISYAAENGIPVSGRIRDENLNKLLPNLNITLYAPEAKGNKMFTARSDSAGRFHFSELIAYGKQNVTLSAVNDKGQSKGAFWVDTLLPLRVKPQLVRNQIKEDSLQKIAVQKRQAEWKPIKIDGVTQLKEVQIKERGKSQAFSVEGLPGNSFTVWGENFDQNFKITPKHYELKTLRWFAINNFYGARVAEDQIGAPGEKGDIIIPYLIINGKAPLFPIDPNLYYSMPLEKFKSIHLQRVVDVHGVVRYLLFIYLKDGYLTDNPGSLTTDVQGYYQARAFYEPQPNAKASLAHYRSTIHWQPDIQTDATGKATVNFNNALPQTDVRVIVEGISKTGIPMAAIDDYEVK